MRNITLAVAIVAAVIGGFASAGETVGDCHNGRCGLAGAAVRVIKAPVVLVDRLIDRPCERSQPAAIAVDACSCVDSCLCSDACGCGAAIAQPQATCATATATTTCHKHRRGFIVRRRCR